MAFLEYSPTKTLYQFSSVDGFRGIITSKELWCTDLSAANDPRELELGTTLFLEAMKFVRENEYKGAIGNFLDDIQKRVTDYRRNQQTFCACFSLVKDDLPMWREYGSNYAGIAIGFRPTAITAMPGRIQKVRYLNPDTQEEFRQLVRDMASKFDPQRNLSDALYWLDAAVGAFTAITSLKHQSWTYEKEIRFVFAQSRKDHGSRLPTAEFSDHSPVYWAKPLNRSRLNTLVDYMAFPFGRRKSGASDCSKAIERVVLGPRCALTEEEVRYLLEFNGYQNFEIDKSDCQIR